MEQEIAKLTGAALDWAVWDCGGHFYDPIWCRTSMPADYTCTCGCYVHPSRRNPEAIHLEGCPYKDWIWSPSTNWEQGGSIIEHNKIGIFWRPGHDNWGAWPVDPMPTQSGPTPLVAAMRCFVAMKHGKVINVPEGL